MEFGLVGLWLGVVLLLGLLARPFAAWLLPGLDHEAFAVVVALAVLGVVGHLVGHLAFGWPAVISGLVILLAIGVRTRNRVTLDHRRFIESAAVFAIAFLFMVAVRSVDPAAGPLPVAIGEKMLDFGLLRSLERAPSLPPEDMWFAGRPIRYHYGGHLVVSLLATLTGTAGRFAYNLGLATFYATLLTTAYGLAGSVAAAQGVPRRTAAALGAFLVGVAGNLDTPARVLVWLLPRQPAAWLAEGLGYDPAIVAWTPRQFFYFDASRVVPVDPTNPNSFMAATEFPLFAWLNGDLHAHMLSQPFTLLVVALLLAYWRAAGRPRRRAALLLGALPPLAGFIGVVNIWSFPTVGGLVALAVALAPGETFVTVPARWSARFPGGTRLTPRWRWRVDELRRMAVAGLAAGAVLALGAVWTTPFWTTVVLGGPAMAPELWGRWMPLGGFLRHHGAFLLVLGLYLVGATAAAADDPHRLWAAGLALFGLGVLVGVPSLGVALPLLLGSWWLLRRRDGGDFVLLLVVAGAGLVLLVELVSVRGERFNTVFKYYAHVWLFWSVASGVALARLRTGWPVSTDDVDLPRWRTIGRGVTAVVVVLGAVYAGFALPTHVGNPGPAVAEAGPTLDATAYVAVVFPDEAPAIRWLDARDGRPVIVTAAPAGYWWRPQQGDGSAAPASLTGLPTVLGWFHERQYRGPDAYRHRLEDVETIYAGPPAEQRRLLRAYDVRYVYVGPAERATYPTVTVDRLDAVTLADRWGDVRIYEVDRDDL